MIKDKMLYVNFESEQTFAEQGRILFSVLNAFSKSGYKILLLGNEAVNNVDVYGRLTFDVKNLSIVNHRPEDTEKFIYLYDQRNSKLNNMPWARQIYLKYDLFSKYLFEQPILMPFPVHPLQETHGYVHRLTDLRDSERQFRILFSGDTTNYRRRRTLYPKEKLCRLEIIDTIKEKLGEKLELVDDETSFISIMKSEFSDKCIIVDNNIRTDWKDWLDLLAKTQFFLSPPGIRMPMCHNIVEAMATGTIPVTNYPEWFHPNLEHGVNCIVFDDKKDLINKINSIFSMDEDKIIKMKKNVIDYYEKYLTKEQFVHRVEEYPNKKLTILYFTEDNAALNPKKLNKYSVLMRDTTIPIKESGIRYQVMRLLGRV